MRLICYEIMYILAPGPQILLLIANIFGNRLKYLVLMTSMLVLGFNILFPTNVL